MTSFNHEKYLAQAIESVLNQTFSDIELIIIDDCSTDNSRAVIEKYRKQDNRVKAFFHKQNLGIARTANDCIKTASGKFISFIGSDDVWSPVKLQTQMKHLFEVEDKIVWSEGEIINERGDLTGQTVTRYLFSPTKTSGNLFEEILKEDFIFGQSAILKTKYAKQVYFNERFKYVSDHAFFVSLSRDHDFVFIQKPLVKYRLHGSNATRKDSKGWMRDRIAVRKFFLQHYSQTISNETRADLYYKIGHAYSNLDNYETAQYYYLKAFSEDYLHLTSFLYLALALTARNKLFNELSAKYYHVLISFFTKPFMQLRKMA